MGADYLPYVAIVLTIVLSIGLVGVILVVNALLGPKDLSGAKSESFECGNPPADTSRKRFSVKFYVVAIFFVVFDIEAVFLFPWAVMYRDLLKSPVYGSIALAEVLVFTGVLAVGLWYVWKKGALDWAFDGARSGGTDD
ncbi:MAG: NADH-quinone oxidoreductase subunit A [Deltaproteobacteria bacterium]|nr:NADH-quinone oxidoreductase subunit A [Deltaproteobacteria bacterium]